MKSKDYRYLNFVKYNLDSIAWNYDVRHVENSSSFIIFGTSFGDVQYFPKSDKIQIHNTNQWKDYGMNWIKKHLKIE